LFRSVTKEEKEKENTRKVMPIANMVTAMPPAGRPSSVQARPIYGILQDDKTVCNVRSRWDRSSFLLYNLIQFCTIYAIFLSSTLIDKLFIRWRFLKIEGCTAFAYADARSIVDQSSRFLLGSCAVNSAYSAYINRIERCDVSSLNESFWFISWFCRITIERSLAREKISWSATILIVLLVWVRNRSPIWLSF
jgi:hypothetical protein